MLAGFVAGVRESVVEAAHCVQERLVGVDGDVVEVWELLVRWGWTLVDGEDLANR